MLIAIKIFGTVITSACGIASLWGALKATDQPYVVRAIAAILGGSISGFIIGAIWI